MKNPTLTIALAALIPFVLDAQVYPLSENSWDNPEFVQRFLGSYGIASEKEPSVSREEKTVLDEIIPIIADDPGQAIVRLEKEINADSSAALDLVLANLNFQQGRLANAASQYAAAIRKFPNFYRAYYNLGRVHVRQGNYPEALPNLRKAIELGGGDGDLYGLLGYCYLNLGEHSTALDAYRMAILLDPESADWRNGKLRTLLDLGMLDEAIPLLYELLEETPENTNLWAAQSNAFLQRDKLVLAAANLEIIRAMGKADARTLAQLGGIYVNAGLTDLAFEAYDDAIASGELRVDHALSIANHLAGRGDHREAEALLDQVAASYGDRLSEDQELAVMNTRSSLALAQGQKGRAAEMLQQVVDRDPLNGKALLLLTDYHIEEGDLAAAEAFASQASKLEAFEVDALLKLGQIKVAQKDFAAALPYIRRAHELKPRSFVADYLARVERAARASS